jgi:hypothetical protein
MDSSDNLKKGFLKHVFNFDNDSKSEMLNIIQYTVIAIVPVVILNKLMQKYVPEADEKKGSVEILAEVLVQIIVMFMGLLIIHRVITYLPTYSGMEYPEFNVIFIILAILMITLSLQTKLGEKVSILVDRVIELWEGPKAKSNGKKSGNVKVSQPISGQNMSMSMPTNTLPTNQSAMNQSLYGGSTSISQLPTNDIRSSGNEYTQSSQNLPNYDGMYRNDTTPLVGAATPGGMMPEAFSEPMAANSVLGGGAFGSW